MAYISRVTTSTESRYAQIEKEALTLTWARFADLRAQITEIEVPHLHRPQISCAPLLYTCRRAPAESAEISNKTDAL